MCKSPEVGGMTGTQTPEIKRLSHSVVGGRPGWGQTGQGSDDGVHLMIWGWDMLSRIYTSKSCDLV
jgi:hypothetical protein